jgi:type IV secretory pathway VirB10-like protein
VKKRIGKKTGFVFVLFCFFIGLYPCTWRDNPNTQEVGDHAPKIKVDCGSSTCPTSENYGKPDDNSGSTNPSDPNNPPDPNKPSDPNNPPSEISLDPEILDDLNGNAPDLDAVDVLQDADEQDKKDQTTDAGENSDDALKNVGQSENDIETNKNQEAAKNVESKNQTQEDTADSVGEGDALE